MWTSRREIVTAVFSLENTAVISINGFWKLMWAKCYLGAIGRNFVWATEALAPWLPRPCWRYVWNVRNAWYALTSVARHHLHPRSRVNFHDRIRNEDDVHPIKYTLHTACYSSQVHRNSYSEYKQFTSHLSCNATLYKFGVKIPHWDTEKAINEFRGHLATASSESSV